MEKRKEFNKLKHDMKNIVFWTIFTIVLIMSLINYFK